MPRKAYLGQRISLLSRVVVVTPPAELELVQPNFRLADPNGEPLSILADIPPYGAESALLKSIRVVARPIDTADETPEELLALSPSEAFLADIDVDGVKDATVALSIAGLPDGSYYLQSVLVPGEA